MEYIKTGRILRLARYNAVCTNKKKQEKHLSIENFTQTLFSMLAARGERKMVRVMRTMIVMAIRVQTANITILVPGTNQTYIRGGISLAGRAEQVWIRGFADR